MNQVKMIGYDEAVTLLSVMGSDEIGLPCLSQSFSSLLGSIYYFLTILGVVIEGVFASFRKFKKWDL